ncbi:MAG: RagB/SusD family nutrient uptake outer membrane protein [Chitinophagaceae bacterium]|jgi:hypothetical protein|nr:RagB/SusD family nutrient uptake outer membrane protein [Chitinophagaceae bacterium]
MKRIKNYAVVLLVSIALLTANSCSNKLLEHPYTVNTVAMFQNAQGIQLALNSVYSGCRWVYGGGTPDIITDLGTDMWTWYDRSNSQALTTSSYTFDYTNGALQNMWNNLYNNINMCNGILTWAPSIAGIDTANVMGQAHFFRGLHYLMLVEQFGAVPVDIGSGDYAFNTSPFGGFNRLPLADILTKDWNGIISDLTYASQNLPDTRQMSQTGSPGSMTSTGAYTLDKAAAFALLAKAYVFKGYSANAASSDWQNAYNAAMQLINNQAQYSSGLLQNYADVTAQGNDYNSEILFAIERIPGNSNANEQNGTSGAGTAGEKDVNAANDYNMSYDQLQCPVSGSGVTPCGTRTPLYGRPMRVISPTPYLFYNVFADKTNDSRFDGTFNTVWLTTVQKTGVNYPSGSSYTGSFTYNVGDTAFVLAHSVDEYNTLHAAQLLSAKPYRVISPAEMKAINGDFTGGGTDAIFPAMKKYWDSKKPDANTGGGRPYPVIKLSEVYILAAEAAMHLGNTAEAASLLNTLRTRAAYRPGLSSTDLATRVTAMQITSAKVTIDFILDELGRELAGEENRWPDLAMRGQLLNRVIADNPPGAVNIKDYMVLRPIPQNQLNALTVPDANQYQNPGW